MDTNIPIGYLKQNGSPVYPLTTKEAVLGLDDIMSQTGRRNYIIRTNSSHTVLTLSESNSQQSNLTVENVNGFKLKLTNRNAVSEGYYRFMTNEFGVLQQNTQYYFNGYLELGLNTHLRFTVYKHTSASAKTISTQVVVKEEGNFKVPFTTPTYSGLTGLTIQVEVLNILGTNKTTDTMSMFNLILAKTDGDWTKAIEDFAGADEYIALNTRVTELEKNGGGTNPGPVDSDTGWLDIQLLGGYKGDPFLVPQVRIKNGWVDFRGNILGITKDKFNFDIAQVPYEAAPNKIKFFAGMVSHDEFKQAKLMINGDGLVKMLVTQESGTISLDGLTYSSRIYT